MTVEGSLELARERDRRGPEPAPGYRTRGGSAAFLGKVVTAAGPGKFLTVNPVVVTGAETAGGSPSYAVDTGTVLGVYVAGAGTPTAGDYLVCRSVAHRWVTEARRAVTPGAVKFITWDCDGTTAIPGVVITMTDGTTTLGPVTTATSLGLAQATITPTSTGAWTATLTWPDGLVSYIAVTVGSPAQTVTAREYFFPAGSLPATATLSTGPMSVGLTLSSGTTYTISGQTYPGIASVLAVRPINNPCTSSTGQETSFTLRTVSGCFQAAYGFITAFCPPGGPGTSHPAAVGSMARANDGNLPETISGTATGQITTISVSPFMVTGTWLNSPQTGGPLAGASWTIS